MIFRWQFDMVVSNNEHWYHRRRNVFPHYCTCFNVQLRPLTTQCVVTVAAVLQTSGLPVIWVCHRDADVEFQFSGI